MRFFVTGTAGFIGFHLARKLLEDGHSVVGYDGVTPYYDQTLKRDRHALLHAFENFRAHEHMLEDARALEAAVEGFEPEVIVHLAAQAGVRYSIESPGSYIDSNLHGTFNVLELARKVQPRHLMIASTSSVYGGNEKMPFTETDRTDFPISLYAATKKACEAMSHSYAGLWNIPTTCFRFFTVYGPWGRPDMALFKFVSAIEAGRPIDVYGNGQMQRDFTYIDDLVESIARLTHAVPRRGERLTTAGVEDSLSPVAPWRVVNIAGGTPVELMTFIKLVERSLGKTALKNMLPMQKGDMVNTASDAQLLNELIGYVPATDVATGVSAFVDWYRNYYQKKAALRAEPAL